MSRSKGKKINMNRASMQVRRRDRPVNTVSFNQTYPCPTVTPAPVVITHILVPLPPNPAKDVPLKTTQSVDPV